jgi:hypothetical protein
MLQLPRMTFGLRACLCVGPAPLHSVHHHVRRCLGHVLFSSALTLLDPETALRAQTPAPAARPAPTPSPQLAQVEAAAKDIFQEYAAAYEALNADRVKKIQPSMDLALLRRTFRDLRELKLTIDEIKVLTVDGPVARVSIRVTQVATPKAGAKPDPNVVTRVVRLRRQEAVWLIDGFER